MAAPLGEIPRATLEKLGRRGLQGLRALFSAGQHVGRHRTHDNQILVLGISNRWGGALQIRHRVMADAIDFGAVQGVLADLGFETASQLAPQARERLVAMLAKAEPSRTGAIRGARHTMLDDCDIQTTRHARAVVGGLLPAVAGDTRLFVSGGAEHQGPDGGSPVAAIAYAVDRAMECH